MSEKAITIKVSNRKGKTVLKGKPESIEIYSTTTIDDAKKQVAKAAGSRDYNRIAIFEPLPAGAMIKDRNALFINQKAIMEAKEILVKDLGKQIGWQSVFFIEYAGPIILSLAVILLRPYLFKGVNASDPLSTVQYTTIAMVIAHFLKREVETAFIHKFSASTMPFFNVFKNSAHYWFLSGINITYWVCSPSSYAARPLTPTTSLVVYAGLALYVIGELGNLNAHLALSSLRSRGGTERGIPRGLMFDTVTCANYFFEVVSWVGILLVSQSLATLIFLIVAAGQMQVWACTKEKALRRDFPETYKQKRYPMIPGLPGPPPRKTKSSK